MNSYKAVFRAFPGKWCLDKFFRDLFSIFGICLARLASAQESLCLSALHHPLAQARAPPLGNCASGPVNLLPILTDKVAIMGMFVPVIYNCFPCAVSRLTPSVSSPFVPFCIPPQLKSAVAILVRVIFFIVFVVNTVLLVFKAASHQYCIVLISACHPALIDLLSILLPFPLPCTFKPIHCEDGSPTTAATSSAASITSEANADYY